MFRARWAGTAIAVVACTLGVGTGVAGAQATTPTAATDQALAEQSVIVDADLPAGWDASPHDASGEAETLQAARAVSACAGYADFEAANDTVPSAQSDDFSAGANGIHSAAYVYPTTAAAKTAMRSLRPTKRVARCLTRLLRTSLAAAYADQPDAQVRAAVRPVEQSLALADSDAVGFGGGYSVGVDGTTANRSFGIAAVRIGRIIGTYTVDTDPEAATVPTAFQGAVDASLRRAQAAQATTP